MAQARAWLRSMLKLVNARREEHGTRFTANIGFTHEGLKAIRAVAAVARQLPRGVPGRHRGRAALVAMWGGGAPAWEGGLGDSDIHGMALIGTKADQGREEATRIVRDEMEATGGVEIRLVGHEGARP